MRQGVESQGLLEQLSIELQELARVCRARIRDDKADIQILRMLGELRDEALLREVHREGEELNTKVPCDMASDLIKQCLSPGHQHEIDPGGRDLPRKFRAYSGRGARDKCPGAEPFFIECCSHLFAPFCLLRACCVTNYSAPNGRAFISHSEYPQSPKCHSSDHLVIPVLCQLANLLRSTHSTTPCVLPPSPTPPPAL